MALLLTATKRTEMGKNLESLRIAGSLPAVVYGPKQESLSITLNQKEFEKVFKVAGESTVVTLTVDGVEIPSLIHEVDHDPVKGTLRHADFYAIVKGQKVEVMVPLEFVGESIAVKDLGGNLVRTLFEIEVEADPMNLPHELNVDITPLLVIGDHVLAKDIVLPPGVMLVTGPDEVVAIIAAANQEPVEEVVAEVDMAAIGDSVERGKKDEEGSEGGEEAK